MCRRRFLAWGLHRETFALLSFFGSLATTADVFRYQNGVKPYNDLKKNDDVVMFLQLHKRHARPPGCPLNVYNVMKGCWLENPNERLTFKRIQQQLSCFLNMTKAQLNWSRLSSHVSEGSANFIDANRMSPVSPDYDRRTMRGKKPVPSDHAAYSDDAAYNTSVYTAYEKLDFSIQLGFDVPASRYEPIGRAGIVDSPPPTPPRTSSPDHLAGPVSSPRLLDGRRTTSAGHQAENYAPVKVRQWGIAEGGEHRGVPETDDASSQDYAKRSQMGPASSPRLLDGRRTTSAGHQAENYAPVKATQWGIAEGGEHRGVLETDDTLSQDYAKRSQRMPQASVSSSDTHDDPLASSYDSFQRPSFSSSSPIVSTELAAGQSTWKQHQETNIDMAAKTAQSDHKASPSDASAPSEPYGHWRLSSKVAAQHTRHIQQQGAGNSQLAKANASIGNTSVFVPGQDPISPYGQWSTRNETIGQHGAAGVRWAKVNESIRDTSISAARLRHPPTSEPHDHTNTPAASHGPPMSHHMQGPATHQRRVSSASQGHIPRDQFSSSSELGSAHCPVVARQPPNAHAPQQIWVREQSLDVGAGTLAHSNVIGHNAGADERNELGDIHSPPMQAGAHRALRDALWLDPAMFTEGNSVVPREGSLFMDENASEC